MTLTILAAADRDWGIGIGGALPWNEPEDLRRFKARTLGKTVVMGRKTVEGLPRALTGRTLAVLTRAPSAPGEFDIDGLLRHLDGIDGEVIVAGGGEVYAALLDRCDRAEITRIGGTFRCDARMPDLAAHGWTLVASEPLTLSSTIEEWKRP